MTTIAALVAATPAATRGVPAGFTYGSGTWRHVLELADPAAGSGVVWYDLTAIDGVFTGYDYNRGSDGYMGHYRASVVNLDFYTTDDSLAPWNDDTSDTFGTHVELGPGLLLRSGFIRVDGGVVVEWLPRFTTKVEFWGDSAYSSGKVRQHNIVARDTMTSLVGVPLPAIAEMNWSDRLDNFLIDSGWVYGAEVYGAEFASDTITPIKLLAARDAVPSAVNELDTICDPTGLVWYTNRKGQLVVRPKVNDTFHAAAFTAGATGTEWPGDDTPVDFAWWACEGAAPGDYEETTSAAYAVDTPGVTSFGFDKSERWVINHVVVDTPASGTIPAHTFDDDDPVSIQRYDRHSQQVIWVAQNDTVAAAMLSTQANATVEARPLHTTSDMENFFPGPANLDFLDNITVQHRNNDEGLQVIGSGWLRSYRELVGPRGCDTEWSLSFTVDTFSTASSSTFLYPVVGLHMVSDSDTHAEFAWTNPSQPIAPTHTQLRLINPSSLWMTTDYPMTEAIWSGLRPSTGYTFQVRLLRIVDGVVTHFSPTRSLAFTTDAPTYPSVSYPDPEVPTDIDIWFPDPTDDPAHGGDVVCVLGWELQQTFDGVYWATIDSGTVLTEPYTLHYDLSAEDPDAYYRFRSRTVCNGVANAWVYSNIIPPDCMPVTRLDEAPYDDADLIAYWPKVCADHVEEAISGDLMTFGNAFDRVDFDSGGWPVMASFGEGIVGYDTPPLTINPNGDLTISCRVMLNDLPYLSRTLFGIGGMWIAVSSDGEVSGNVYESDGMGGVTFTSIEGSTILDLDTVYYLALKHDVAGGNLYLRINSVHEASVGSVGMRHNLGYYEIGVPANSWVTDCAVWDRVLSDAELPSAGLPAVFINQAVGQEDPTYDSPIVFDVVFSEPVTGFTSDDVVISGTAGATAGIVAGSGAVYTVSVHMITIAMSSVVSSGSYGGLFVDGDYLYAAHYASDGLRVFDISTPGIPEEVGFVTHATSLNGPDGVVVDGIYAYVVSDNTLTVVDVSDPTDPTIVGTTSSATRLDGLGNRNQRLAKSGSFVYVGGYSNYFSVVDVSDPTSPFIEVHLQNSAFSSPVGVAMFNGDDSCLVTGTAVSAVSVDVSSPAAPAIDHDLLLSDPARSVVVEGSIAYIAGSNRIYTVDLSNPAVLVELDSVTTPTAVNCEGIVKVGNYCYVASWVSFQGRVEVFDVSNPANLSHVTRTESSVDLWSASGITVSESGSHLYVGTADGIAVIGIV